MPEQPLPRTLIVNFNAPELNQLALAFAHAGRLDRYVRPYVNKGRGWERALAAVPLAGGLYGSTFGRRQMRDPELARLTCESGVLPDVLAACALRSRFLPDAVRARWTNALVAWGHRFKHHEVAHFASDDLPGLCLQGLTLWVVLHGLSNASAPPAASGVRVPAMTALGDWSYPLYVVHVPVYAIVGRLLGAPPLLAFGAALATQAECVLAYEGFALPAFAARRAAGQGNNVLNYPIAHHRVRRRERLEEIERMPQFASTWPDFDDWPAGHEERLDEEVAHADAVLVGSTYAADTFVAEGISRARMKVVPYGVDLQVFAPGPADGRAPREDARFQAIFTGQLTQRKGLSYLLEGWRRFGRTDAQLTLVGQPVGDARALAPYAGLFRHVPHRTRPQLAQHYRASDVFVFPTLVEGMPLVVLEAMACGLPVIVTANGPADIVRDGIDGFVIPARDPDAIVARLDQMYRDPALREEMGRNASRRAAEFGWPAYTAKAQACLAELFAASRTSPGSVDQALMPTGASLVS